MALLLFFVSMASAQASDLVCLAKDSNFDGGFVFYHKTRIHSVSETSASVNFSYLLDGKEKTFACHSADAWGVTGDAGGATYSGAMICPGPSGDERTYPTSFRFDRAQMTINLWGRRADCHWED